MSIEEPKFSRVIKDGAFELRDYSASVAAEVTVKGDQHSAGNRGFRLLAAYIFGGNAKAQKIAMTAPVTKRPITNTPVSETIAMTAPVTQVAGSSGEWRVWFTMPHAYSLGDLPIPNDPKVQLKAQAPARFAVLRFSGLTGVARVAEQSAKLMALAKAKGLIPTGPIALARYDPPWTLWFLRRNEVMLPIRTA